MSPNPQTAAPAYDDAEKGTLEITQPLPVFTTDTKDEKAAMKDMSPPLPTLTKTAHKPPAKKKVSKWILWKIWFNTYRYPLLLALVRGHFLTSVVRKLFTFTFSFNIIGIGLAASGHWPYALKYNSAMALANLNFAILMRNEIFGRVLYLVVNTLFAKVHIGDFPPLFLETHTAHSGHHCGGDWAVPPFFRYVYACSPGCLSS